MDGRNAITRVSGKGGVIMAVPRIVKVTNGVNVKNITNVSMDYFSCSTKPAYNCCMNRRHDFLIHLSGLLIEKII